MNKFDCETRFNQTGIPEHHLAISGMIRGEGPDTMFSACRFCGKRIVTYWLDEDDTRGGWLPWALVETGGEI
jgi:hypothetical protein